MCIRDSSAGVSTRRVALPVLIASAFTVSLSVVNQEFILPCLDGFFIENRSNVDGDKEIDVKGAYDVRGVHISGKKAIPKDLLIKRFTCVIPTKVAQDSMVTLQANEARYIPEGHSANWSGGWLLSGAEPAELPNWSNDKVLQPIAPGRYFLHTDADFARVTRPRNWFLFITTWNLLDIMNRPGNSQLAGLAVIFHTRLTRPLLGVVLVLTGLGIILRDMNRNIFISASYCLALCAGFFATIIACQYLGDRELLSPAFAAWLPIMAFGPFALVFFDAVHT